MEIQTNKKSTDRMLSKNLSIQQVPEHEVLKIVFKLKTTREVKDIYKEV
jgi:hypothetical protein